MPFRKDNYMPAQLNRALAVALIVLIISAASPALAKDVNADAGTSSFPFLKINVGARAVAMGGAFTGLANDATALYYNPAGLTTFERDNFIAGYHNYFEDLQSGVVGYFRKASFGTLGAHVTYLNYGEFVETDGAGNVLGEFSGGDLMFGVSYAREYNSMFSFGATAKFIYEKLEDYSASGVAIDLGARFETEELDSRGFDRKNKFTAGIMIQNLGTTVSDLGDESYSLPLMLRGGGSAQLEGLPLVFTGDVILPTDNDIHFAAGAEYFELKPLYLRAGWNSFGSNYKAEDSNDGWAGMSFGAGFDYRGYHISYAVLLSGDLGEGHRITLTGGI